MLLVVMGLQIVLSGAALSAPYSDFIFIYFRTKKEI